MRSVALGVLVLTSCTAVLCAQQAAKSTGTTVTGHVFLQDTNGPARMATVMLQPTEAVDASRSEKKLDKAMTTQSVQTLLDGSFTIPNVQPGAYYVVATAPGYVSPLYALLAAGNESQKDDGASKKLAALAPRITVQANLPASVSVNLERGAAVSGTVLYDDGSPASDVRVQILVRKKDKWITAPSMPFKESIPSTLTDDRGNYRISGLPAQEYAVEVRLSLQKWLYEVNEHGNTMSSTSDVYSLPVYSGNRFRMKEAEGFSVTQGEDRGGEDIEIPVSRLHTLRGTVIAAHDGHLINGGRVQLIYPDDKSVLDTAVVTRDAEFNFSFVPEGDYMLRVSDAADTEYKEVLNGRGAMPPTHTETSVVRRYGEAEIPIHIAGDAAGVVISAPDIQIQGLPASN